MSGEQLVPPSSSFPGPEAAHHVPNTLTLLPFQLSSSSPSKDSASPSRFSLLPGRVSYSLPCAKDNVHSSTHTTFQPIPGSLSHLLHIWVHMYFLLLQNPCYVLFLWRVTSFIPFIVYTHNSWIKTKGKPQIPNSCHEQQDK